MLCEVNGRFGDVECPCEGYNSVTAIRKFCLATDKGMFCGEGGLLWLVEALAAVAVKLLSLKDWPMVA